MTTNRLGCSAVVLANLQRHAEAMAPTECCGVLLGRGDTVVGYRPMANRAAAPRHAFAFDDAEWLRAARAADDAALEVLGIAHSHVDAPAEPSGLDLAQAEATRWMLIVPVSGGRAGDARAFRNVAGRCVAADFVVSA